MSFERIKIDLTINISIYKLLKPLLVETNKVLNESDVEDRHLVAGFENNVVAGSRFERIGSVIALPNLQKPCQTSSI